MDRHTILVVDDEPRVRSLVATFLGRRGYQVLQASNGQEALRLMRDTQETIEVLVTDVVMPELDGPALANILWGTRPEMPILFISGYTDERLESLAQSAQARAWSFLSKPFMLNELETAVVCLLSKSVKVAS